jgi:hypothetical protein
MAVPSFDAISALDTGTTTADRTPAVPAGVANGSFVGIVVASNANTNPATNATDFNNLVAQTQASSSVKATYKIATGADAGTYSVPHTAPGGSASSALAYRMEGEHASPIGLTSSNSGAGISTIPTTSLVGVTADSKLVHVVASFNARTYTPPTGPGGGSFTRQTANVSQRLHLSTFDMPAGGNTGNINGSMSSTGNIVALLFEIKGGNTLTLKVMSVVMDGNPSLLTRLLALRSLTAIMDGTPTLTRLLSGHRTLAPVMDGTPSLTTDTSHFRTLTAVMNGITSITRKVGKSLTAVMDGTPTLVRETGKTLTAVMDGTPTLTRDITAHRTLTVVMDGNTTLTTRSSRFKQLIAVMDGTGTLSPASVLGRVLTAIMNGIPRGFVEFPWDSIPSECPEDWSPNDGTKSIEGFVFFHEPPNEGQPVDGATVTLIRDSDGLRITTTTTDPAGHYSFPRDTNDPYTYHVEVRYTNQQGLSEGGCAPA